MLKNIQFLLRRKRKSEQGQIYITSAICTGKQISDFIEFLDLEIDLVDYDIKLIDSNTFRLHKVCFDYVGLNYETGSHVRHICKGTKVKKDEFGYILNLICSEYYSSDH